MIEDLCCRFGNHILTITSDAMKLSELADLAGTIIARRSGLQTSGALCRKKEELFVSFIQLAKARHERDRLSALVDKERNFTRPFEYYEKQSKERPDVAEADENGLPPGSRRTPIIRWGGLTDDGKRYQDPVAEISLEHAAYSAMIESNGSVHYSAGGDFFTPGNYNGHIPVWKYSQLSDFIQSAKIMEMKDSYDDYSITDQEVIITSFVISGQRKTISEYAYAGPPILWAIDELIDKLIDETEWEGKKPSKKRKFIP